MSDVTQILAKIEHGDEHATAQLLPLVYAELRQLAAARMASERSDHTLQPTALVHEAYVRLVNADHTLRWDSRGHFYAAAAEAMRRILVEHARRKLGKQRGGKLPRVELLDNPDQRTENHELVLQVSDALEKLVTADAQAAELVKLHCFAGFSIPEAAEILGIAKSTAYAHWTYAKAMMGRLLSDPEA